VKQKAITIEGVRLEPQVFVYGYVNGKKRPEKSAWENAKQRCFNPNDPDWPNYGGRGITMCEEWRRSFTRFFLDMGERPSPRHSLDRIDVNGHYEPSNCRWATFHQQALNKRARQGTSEFRGVELFRNGKWRARVTDQIRGEVHIGYFADELDAALAFDISALQLRGQEALTNITGPRISGEQ